MRILLALFLVALSPAPAHAQSLGGFTLTARATPVSVLLHTDLIPVPAEPQGEVHVSYTQTELGSGPIGRSLASSLWPGAVIGTGLPQMFGFAYPVQVNAAHPGGPADETKSGMRAHADATGVHAVAGAAQEVPFLLTTDGLNSTSTSAVTATEARASSMSSANTITLLSGLVRLSGVRIESQAVSDGKAGRGTSTFAIAAITVAGKDYPVTAGRIPDGLADALAPLGITMTWPTTNTKIEGTAATSTSQGLTLTVDVALLRSKLGLGKLLDGLAPLLPEKLVPLLNPLRKLVFIVGDTSAAANAAPGAPAANAPAETPPAQSGPDIPPGAALPATPPMPGIAPPRPAPPARSVRPKPRPLMEFPGVPALLVVAGLGVAAVGAHGLRSLGGFLLGGAPCPSGHPTGVPDLRDR